jgi:adenosylcobinamide-GDP ribazoletransferase
MNQLKSHLRLPKAFIFAVQFLTRIPLGKHHEYEPELAATAVAWYGVVGLLMGSVLALSGWVLTDWIDLPSLLVAALVLTIWVVITGALHLDGVGDCGDALMGGHTSERMLEIMKDTNCGIGAIVAVALVLLVKLSALIILLDEGSWYLLLFAPVMARVILTLVLLYLPYFNLPYLRSNGLATKLNLHLNTKEIITTGLLLSLSLVLIWFQGFIVALIASAVGYLLIHRSLIKPLKGTTGDIYGSVVEVTEAAVLIGLVAAL